MRPDFTEEKQLWDSGCRFVLGIDEAGRGCIAGPVVAAAVAIKSGHCHLQEIPINDSKKLTAKSREMFYQILTSCSVISWGIGIVSEKMIDKINIKNAAELAMEKAVKNLQRKYKITGTYLLIDGKYLKNAYLQDRNHKLIVGADGKVFSCSAASIIAKVTRDRLMMKLHKKYPQYGFDRNKGYLTGFHFDKVMRLGPSDIHRKTFAPVFNLVGLDNGKKSSWKS